MSMADNGSGTPPIVEESKETFIEKELRQMAAERRKLAEVFKSYEKKAKARLGKLTREAHQAYEVPETDQGEVKPADIQKIMEEKVKEMKQLKEKVELCLKEIFKETVESKDSTSEADKTSESDEWEKMDKELEKMLETDAKGDKGEAFDRLPETYRNCLLCLSIFPVGSEISKRVLIYWWIGEGFVTQSEKETAEQVGEVYFQQFLDHEFIHPVYNKRSGNIVKCRIHPWIHWMLISKARETQFFNFDETGTPISSPSNLHHACLITKLNDGQQEQKSYKPDEQLRLLFNVNVKYLDLDLESFSKMKNIVVLQLGRWHASAHQHIEMDPQVLEKLSSLSNLKYLSLRGISVIDTIPKSISKLQYLQVLDLRGCQNLKNLTDGITKLRRLTHLDVSECYMLESMPKGLGSLSELLVIKGFVISRSHRKTGKIADLLNLHKLKKLSIIIGSQVKKSRDLGDLVNMEGLSSLTVIWSDLPDTTPGYVKHDVDSLKLPRNLEKLDLRFYPTEHAPKWLDPDSTDAPTWEKLKKLYITGGKLGTLVLKHSAEGTHPKWNIQTLRLKFLKKLKLNWPKIELPSLNYLEHYECGIMDTPPLMDADGVWTRVKEPDSVERSGADSPKAPPPPSPSHDPNTAPSLGASSSGAPSLADKHTSGTPPVPSGSVPAPSTAPNATHDASPVSSPSSSTNTSVPPANEADLKDDLKDKSKHDPSSSASTAAHLTDLNTTSPDGVSVSTSRAAEPISGTPQVPSHSVPTLSAASDVTRDASVLSSPSSSTDTSVPRANEADLKDDLKDESKHDPRSSTSTAAQLTDLNTTSPNGGTDSAFGATSVAAEPISGTAHVPSQSVPPLPTASDVTRGSDVSSPSSSTNTSVPPADEADLKDDRKHESKQDPSSSTRIVGHLTDMNTTSPDDVTVSTSSAAALAPERISGTPYVPSHTVPTPTVAPNVIHNASLASGPSSTTTSNQPSVSAPAQVNSNLESPLPAMLFHTPAPIVTSYVIPDSTLEVAHAVSPNHEITLGQGDPAPADLPPLDPPSSLSN